MLRTELPHLLDVRSTPSTVLMFKERWSGFSSEALKEILLRDLTWNFLARKHLVLSRDIGVGWRKPSCPQSRRRATCSVMPPCLRN